MCVKGGQNYRVPFSSCPVCGYWRGEQTGENGRNTTKKKRGQYLSFTAEKMAQVARYASTKQARYASNRHGMPLTQDSTLKHSIFPHGKFTTHVPSSEYTFCHSPSKIYYRAKKFKTTKFNSGSLFQLLVKISTYKITRYTYMQKTL